MGYTQAQIKRIMATRRAAYVPRETINYAGRVCETYLRKKLYRWEDKAATAAYQRLQQANRAIREYGLQLADQYALDELTVDGASIQWQRQVVRYAEQQFLTALEEIAYAAFKASVTAYAAGYYGRLWLLEQATHGQRTILKPRLSTTDAVYSVLQPGTQSTFGSVTNSYDVLGTEWQERFRGIAQQGTIKLRTVFNQALVNEDAPRQALATVASLIGVKQRDNRGLYYQAQLLIRSAIIRASNFGAVAAYQTQDSKLREASETRWLIGTVWVTANDGRVCPKCASQAGRIFIINDLFGIALFGLPPDGSHYGCRCTMLPLLIPLEGEENTPPEDTFDEWLMDEGFFGELDEWFEDDRLESTQI